MILTKNLETGLFKVSIKGEGGGDLQGSHDAKAQTIRETQPGISKPFIGTKRRLLDFFIRTDDPHNPAGKQPAAETHGPIGMYLGTDQSNGLVQDMVRCNEARMLIWKAFLNRLGFGVVSIIGIFKSIKRRRVDEILHLDRSPVP